MWLIIGIIIGCIVLALLVLGLCRAAAKENYINKPLTHWRPTSGGGYEEDKT